MRVIKNATQNLPRNVRGWHVLLDNGDQYMLNWVERTDAVEVRKHAGDNVWAFDRTLDAVVGTTEDVVFGYECVNALVTGYIEGRFTTEEE